MRTLSIYIYIYIDSLLILHMYRYKRVSAKLLQTHYHFTLTMDSIASAITIHFAGEQPFVAGQHVTGTLMFNNTLQRGVKFQSVHAGIFGEVIYTTIQSSGKTYRYVTHHEPFFGKLINLVGKQVRRLVSNETPL